MLKRLFSSRINEAKTHFEFIFERLIKSNDYEENSIYFIEQIKKNDDFLIKSLIDSIKVTIKGKKFTVQHKFQALLMLKDAMETKIEPLAKYVTIKILRRLRIFAQFDRKNSNFLKRGMLLFGPKQDGQKSRDFFILLLEMLKIWSLRYSPENVCTQLGEFRKTYQILIMKGVLFPDSYKYFNNSNIIIDNSYGLASNLNLPSKTRMPSSHIEIKIVEEIEENLEKNKKFDINSQVEESKNEILLIPKQIQIKSEIPEAKEEDIFSPIKELSKENTEIIQEDNDDNLQLVSLSQKTPSSPSKENTPPLSPKKTDYPNNYPKKSKKIESLQILNELPYTNLLDSYRELQCRTERQEDLLREYVRLEGENQENQFLQVEYEGSIRQITLLQNELKLLRNDYQSLVGLQLEKRRQLEDAISETALLSKQIDDFRRREERFRTEWISEQNKFNGIINGLQAKLEETQDKFHQISVENNKLKDQIKDFNGIQWEYQSLLDYKLKTELERKKLKSENQNLLSQLNDKNPNSTIIDSLLEENRHLKVENTVLKSQIVDVKKSIKFKPQKFDRSFEFKEINKPKILIGKNHKINEIINNIKYKQSLYEKTGKLFENEYISIDFNYQIERNSTSIELIFFNKSDKIFNSFQTKVLMPKNLYNNAEKIDILPKNTVSQFFLLTIENLNTGIFDIEIRYINNFKIQINNISISSLINKFIIFENFEIDDWIEKWNLFENNGVFCNKACGINKENKNNFGYFIENFKEFKNDNNIKEYISKIRILEELILVKISIINKDVLEIVTCSEISEGELCKNLLETLLCLYCV